MASPLSASIVIVTFNRADSLDRTLASLHQLR
jgi:glycosyltransferase involved in cell wall biosynthesis